jgi:hypothetical protein
MLDFTGVVDGSAYPAHEEGLAPVMSLDVVRPRFDDYKAAALQIVDDVKGLDVVDDETLNLAVMIGGNAKKFAKRIDAQRKEIISEPSEFVKGVNAIAKAITDSLDEAERVAKQKIGQHQARIEMERRKAEEAARKAAAELQMKLQAEADEANRKAREEAARIAEAETKARLAREAEERAKSQAAMESQKQAAEREKREQEQIESARKAAEAEAAKHYIEAPVVITPVIPEGQGVLRTEAASAHQRKVWAFKIIEMVAVPREYLAVNEQSIRDAIKMGIRNIPGIHIFEETKTVFRT